MEYKLDMEAAKSADSVGTRIDEKGKYVGIIIRAEAVTSKKGSKGVDLSFKADTGATANYLTIWTHNSEGKQLSGYGLLMALMTCLRVKELKTEQGDIEKYDPSIGKVAKVTVPLFKELMNKPVGLLMHMEEYRKNNGDTAWKPAISVPFDKEEFTASEILSKAVKPENLPKMVQMLRDRPLKAETQTDSANSAGTAKKGNFFDDGFDDDIPF